MFTKKITVYLLLLTTLLTLTSCGKPKTAFTLKAIAFADLPNWDNDRLSEAWPAFIRSCMQLIKLPADTVFLNESKVAAWQTICKKALSLKEPSETMIRDFFTDHFTPYRVTSNLAKEGLFTGYYEPVIKGSRIKNKKFNAPLYKRPKDLVMIDDLSLFRKELKGVRIAGRVIKGNLVPYYTHAEINKGIIADDEFMWLEDPVDTFFIQIQGSAAIKLANGDLVHLNYAGSNGHLYTPIGKVLVERKALTLKDVSMQSIRTWLKTHPEQVKSVLEENASYVFFKESTGAGPIGAEGVVLTARRSLAVDPKYIAFGTPIWLDITHPTEKNRLQSLVIAQDKGGAIKGPIRGDLFWGSGKEAGAIAGTMKSTGNYYVLLPNKVDLPPCPAGGCWKDSH